jgi:hypothetical protein
MFLDLPVYSCKAHLHTGEGWLAVAKQCAQTSFRLQKNTLSDTIYLYCQVFFSNYSSSMFTMAFIDTFVFG